MLHINLDDLKEFYGNSIDSIIELFEEFLNSFDTITNDLQESYVAKDLKKLKGNLHHHGPMFSYIGLNEISKEFKDLEKKCLETEQFADIELDYNRIIKFVEHSKSEVIEKKGLLELEMQ